MGREERLTRPQQYASVYRKGIHQSSPLLVLRALPNSLAFSRYGFSVSKRVGKAVVRNRMKRLLREILRLTPLRPAWDIVFVVRPAAAGASYAALKETVGSLLNRAGLMASEKESREPSRPVRATEG